MSAIFDTECPWCHRINNLHSDAEGTIPEAGDLSICWRCKQLSVYTEDFKLRMPTAEEFSEAIKDPEVRKVLGLARTEPSPAQAVRRWKESSS